MKNDTKSSGLPKYPIEVWDGTAYGEFAELCGQGNNIPREFFIEALKTVTGAILNDRLASRIKGGNPRFYTVIIGPAGCGKGTAIGYVDTLFDNIDELHDTAYLWIPTINSNTNLGACRAAFSSLPGLQLAVDGSRKPPSKPQSRLLWIAEEIDVIFESGGIAGSGGSLMGAIRSLYDSEIHTATGNGQRISSTLRVKLSLLGGTTPEIWSGLFAGKGAAGSGLFGRLNLVATLESHPVGTLTAPDLDPFRQKFFKLLAPLEKEKGNIVLDVDDNAKKTMNDWFEGIRERVPDADEHGRLNVLAWKNALHLAWLCGGKAITNECVMKAIRLSEYQADIRVFFKPLAGDNAIARVEDAIRNFLRGTRGFVTTRELEQALNAMKKKCGSDIWRRAISNLVTEVVVAKEDQKQVSGQVKKGLRWVGD